MIDARSIEMVDGAHLVLGHWTELHGYPSYSSGATGSFVGASNGHRATTRALSSVYYDRSGRSKYEGDAWGYYSYRVPSDDDGEATLKRMEASITLWTTLEDDGGRVEGWLHNIRSGTPGQDLKDHNYHWNEENFEDYQLKSTYIEPDTGGPASGNTEGRERVFDQCNFFACRETEYVDSSGKWGAQFYGDAQTLAGTFGFEGSENGFEVALTGVFLAERFNRQ